MLRKGYHSYHAPFHGRQGGHDLAGGRDHPSPQDAGGIRELSLSGAARDPFLDGFKDQIVSQCPPSKLTFLRSGRMAACDPDRGRLGSRGTKGGTSCAAARRWDVRGDRHAPTLRITKSDTESRRPTHWLVPLTLDRPREISGLVSDQRLVG